MSPRRPDARATDPAAERFSRLVRLLPSLASGGPVPYRELARRVGTDEAQVREDLRQLQEQEADVPGGFVAGFRLVMGADAAQVDAELFRRPMALLADELAALLLGLVALGQDAAEDAAAVDGARRKLARLALRGQGAVAEAGALLAANGPRAGRTADGAPVRHLAALQRAWAARETVSLTYATGGAAPRARTVEPWRLVWARGGWYLLGRDPAKGLVQFYRLDRVRRVATVGRPFVIPGDFSLDAHLADGRPFTNPRPDRLVVRYSARIARWIAEHQRGVVRPDGALEVEHPLGDDAWAVRHVLQYGPDAVVVSPARVRRQVQAALRAMAR